MAISPISLCTCLFFESQAEEAARFYTSIFPHSSIETINHFMDTGHEIHKQRVGSVMSVIVKTSPPPLPSLENTVPSAKKS